MAVFHVVGNFEGERYVLRAENVFGVRREDHEPLGGTGASYELLIEGNENIRVDEESAKRVEDYLTRWDTAPDETEG